MRISVNPLVSVVIPAYNAEAFVADAIESALAQTYRPIEILVADDGSTDGTAEVVKRYGPPVRYLHRQNGGPAAARNTALRCATGEFIAFLDADDVWHPEKTETQIKAMERNPDISICGTRKFSFTDASALEWADFPAECEVNRIPGATLVVSNRFSTSTVVVRAECAREIGEFDEDIFGPEDWDYWRRITVRHDGLHLNLDLVAYRVAEESVSTNAQRMYENQLKVLRKSFAANPNLGFGVRMRAMSHLHFDTALEFRKTSRRRALAHMFKSLLIWPLPLGVARLEPFMRLKVGASALLGLFRTA